jgi:transcriptional regulator with XRE-family HTH domain
MSRTRRRSATEGARLVERYEASGLTQREFADRNGVTMSTLQYWLRKARSGDEAPVEQFRFVEVVENGSPDSATGGMSMEFVDGLMLRFEGLPSPSYLAEVVTAVAEE